MTTMNKMNVNPVTRSLLTVNLAVLRNVYKGVRELSTK